MIASRTLCALLFLAVMGCATALPTSSIIDSSNIEEAFAEREALYGNTTNLLGGGTYGVDISQGYGASTFKCLRSKGFSFAVVRAWRSICSPDPAARGSIQAAWAGGMNKVDVYFFPAFRCGKSAVQQVNEAISSLKGMHFGTMWFDIESQGSNWSSNSADNVRWLTAAVNRANKVLGPGRVGIYTSRSTWVPMFGNNANFGQYPVWYAHYDAKPAFSDWVPFGGWHVPSIKQFNDGPEVCGASIDHNWF